MERHRAGQPGRPADRYSLTMAENCFGCGDDNPQGLHIQYVDEADATISTTLSLSWLHSGEPGIVHGGIQATILDEVLGRVAQRTVTEAAGERSTVVTASFQLRYRSPCLTGSEITARARLHRIEWPSVFVEGEITDSDGLLLTEATARWRVIDDDQI